MIFTNTYIPQTLNEMTMEEIEDEIKKHNLNGDLLYAQMKGIKF